MHAIPQDLTRHKRNALAKLELQHTRNISGTEKSESVEDKHFLRILITNMQRNGKGNWEMPLPFKTDDVTLPSNLEQCMKRLLGIKKEAP